MFSLVRRVELIFVLLFSFTTTLSTSPSSYEYRNSPEPRKKISIYLRYKQKPFNGPPPRFSETLLIREEHKQPAKEKLKEGRGLLTIDKAGVSS